MRIAITGATGYIGARLRHHLQKKHEITSLTRRSCEGLPPFDLSQPSSLRRTLRLIDVDLIIHAAAIARRKQCMVNPEIAYVVNVEATRVIAEWARHCKIRLIFLSSMGIHEDNIYANTKRLAEQAIQAAGATNTILRLAYTFGFSPSRSRPKPVQQLELEAQRPGAVSFDDSWHFQPTSIEHVCHVVEAVVEVCTPPQEANVATTEATTMFEVASACLPHQILACKDLKDRPEHFISEAHLSALGLPECSLSSLFEEVREMLKPPPTPKQMTKGRQ